jgi:TolB-like protein/DNA-binding SARP family transcriptional activator/Tfp pilus assembly protein PilF
VFTLKLLGGASLEGPDGPLTGRVSQRRRLAVLALLATSRRPGVSREKLIATLWPESDGDRARHLLSDTVYVVNRALGGEVITAVADELRLQEHRLTCDARAFEQAIERGDLEAASRLYTGSFLEGFFVEGSDEFERWASAERARLQNLYGRALEQLAVERSDHGDRRGAVECWRRLAAEDPFNSRVVCRLAGALDDAGDRAGALQQIQGHIATLARELGLGPPEEVTLLARSLQATRAPVEPPPQVSAIVPGPVAPSDEPTPLSAGRPVAVPTDPNPPPPSALADSNRTLSWRRPRIAIAGGVVALLLIIAAVRAFWPRPSSAVTAASLQSIAVLPFADLSPQRDQAYFSEGIAEELSTRLARIPGLKVAARTSAFAFKGTDTDVMAIGRALSVDALLEGSVRQAEGRVRIAVRLVNAQDGYQIWADSWERGGRDVLAMQDDIASGVVRALRADTSKAAGSNAAPRVVDPAAYDLYLQGRYFWHQRTRDGLMRAAAAFDRAVGLAPTSAEAHSGVADAYAVLGFYDHLPPRQAFPRAKAAAEQALRIDDRLAEAHASLGYIALYYDWDWPAAERALRRSIELNPSYSIGHQWLGNYLVARGRFNEAVIAMRRAQEVDPLSLIASAAVGWVHYYRRDYDGAVQQCRRTIDLNPNFEQAWVWGGWAHEAAGRHAEALEMFERAATLSKRGAVALAGLGRAHARSGDSAAALRILDELRRDHTTYLPAYEIATLHIALGARDEALTWLRRAYDQRSHSLVFLAVDPQLDPLRADPGFRDLLARTGVASH